MNDRLNYDSICSGLESLIGSSEPLSAFSNASSYIFHALSDVSWVGFYFYDAENEKMILGPFQGKPACVEIRKGKGVCGYSLAAGVPVVVPDVHQFPGHIACDVDSRSEIVVPIKVNGNVVALLDIDSTSVDRFTSYDLKGIEKAARVIEDYSESHFPFDFL